MRIVLSALLVVGALGATGCVVRGSAGYSAGYSGSTTVVAPAPNLVYVSPGVQVIADYDYPVFYSSNWYWRYDNGVWYRSRYYDRGWYVSYDVPVHIRRIDRPHTYVRYRANVRHDNGVRAHGHGGVHVRDHRDQGRPVHVDDRGRGPAVRDHRDQGPPVHVDRTRGPAIRDHRDQGPPADRGPAVRDHRDQGPPADRGPAVRDHRDQAPPPARDKRADDDDDKRGPKVRDHRK